MSALAGGAGGTRVRAVAADDSIVIREALAAMLAGDPDVELVGLCSDGNELRRAVEDLSPDVAILDIRMPPSGTDEGIQAARELRRTHPGLGVVVFSQHVEPAYALDLMADGTQGRAYLLKDRIRAKDELVAAVRAVARGGSAIDPLVVDALIQGRARERSSPLSALTPREREILGLIAEGASNGAIAERLVLSKRAVEKHVNAIFAKLSLPEPEEVSRRVAATLAFLAAEGRLAPADGQAHGRAAAGT